MCKLCVRYGREPLEDKEQLATAIAEIAREMELQPSSSMHYLDLLDLLLDGKDPEDLDNDEFQAFTGQEVDEETNP